MGDMSVWAESGPTPQTRSDQAQLRKAAVRQNEGRLKRCNDGNETFTANHRHITHS